MAEYEAIISTDDNLNVDVSTDIDVPVTVTDDGFLSVSVEPDANALSIDADVEPDEIIDVPVQEGLGGIASDHRLLLHRDAANQHPMSAIEGLQDALSGIESTLETRILDAENDITNLSLVEEADRITMANAVIRIDNDISILQNQVDGNITTWFYDYVPTTGNSPASDWILAGEEAVHLGDLFYNTTTGYVYRWMSNNATPPVYSWTRITDSDVTKALEDAAKAQDTADHKRRVFVATPVPPYDAGDLWFVGVSGDILTCTHGRLESEYYDSGDWSKLHKYTDDTRANEAYTLANNAKLSADGKNRIFRQNSQPTGGNYGAGDIWFDTAHDNKIYRYNGSSWVGFTLGDDAIGNLNASHINAGTIDANVVTVSNLDAGNITTGTIDADRIDASTLTINNSGLATIADISNENLLIDSQTMDAWGLGSQASLDTSGEFGVITMTPSADNTWNATFNSRPTLDTSILNGKTMWFSFEYTLSAASSVAISINGASQAVGSMTVTRTKYLSKYVAYDATSSWKKAVVAMPTSVSQLTSGSGDVNSLYVSIFNYQHANTVMKVRKLKLEHGVSASDWTPSVEDYKAYIARIDGNGIRAHPASTMNNSAVINADGMEIFKGGTTSAYSVAKYGDTARIGKSSTRHVEVSDNGLQIMSGSSSVLANFGYGTVNSGSGTTTAGYFTLGSRKSGGSIGNASVAFGNQVEASGGYSLAGGTTLSETVSGSTTTTYTTASGGAALAFGAGCTASADMSAAFGQGTTARWIRQFVVGRNNALTSLDNSADHDLFIVGNGTSTSARSNALSVKESGDVYINGNLYVKSNAAGTSGTKIGVKTDVSSNFIAYSTSPFNNATIQAYQQGNLVYVRYKLSAVGLNKSTTSALMSVYSGYRPLAESIFLADITDANYSPICVGTVRFETGGWVYLRTPASMSQTSSLYVMFNGVYII